MTAETRQALKEVAARAMAAQSDPHAQASTYRNALIDICSYALAALQAEPSTLPIDPEPRGWHCACGWPNGVNLSTCACCGRAPGGAENPCTIFYAAPSAPGGAALLERLRKKRFPLVMHGHSTCAADPEVVSWRDIEEAVHASSEVPSMATPVSHSGPLLAARVALVDLVGEIASAPGGAALREAFDHVAVIVSSWRRYGERPVLAEIEMQMLARIADAYHADRLSDGRTPLTNDEILNHLAENKNKE